MLFGRKGRRPHLLLALLLVVLVVLPACASAGTPVRAPDFSLTSADGREVSLVRLREENRAVVLVFYRGFF